MRSSCSSVAVSPICARSPVISRIVPKANRLSPSSPATSISSTILKSLRMFPSARNAPTAGTPKPNASASLCTSVTLSSSRASMAGSAGDVRRSPDASTVAAADSSETSTGYRSSPLNNWFSSPPVAVSVKSIPATLLSARSRTGSPAGADACTWSISTRNGSACAGGPQRIAIRSSSTASTATDGGAVSSFELPGTPGNGLQ